MTKRKNKKKASERRANIRGIIFVVTLIVIVVGVMNFSDIRNSIRINKYQGEAIGQISSYKKNEYRSQGFDGAKDQVLNYTVDYSFDANGTTYHKSIIINSNKTSPRELNNYKNGGASLKVRYDLNDPNNNTIVLREN